MYFNVFFPYYMIFFILVFLLRCMTLIFLILYDMCDNLDFTFLHVDLHKFFFGI